MQPSGSGFVIYMVKQTCSAAFRCRFCNYVRPFKYFYIFDSSFGWWCIMVNNTNLIQHTNHQKKFMWRMLRRKPRRHQITLQHSYKMAIFFFSNHYFLFELIFLSVYVAHHVTLLWNFWLKFNIFTNQEDFRPKSGYLYSQK